MQEQQKTLSKAVTLSGIALHTGNHAQMTLRPAPAGSGVHFVRVDLPGKPRIPASVHNVVDVTRETCIAAGEANVHTVEHVLAALSGLGIDNLDIELTSNEPPIADGSARQYVALIQEAGIEVQGAPRNYFELKESVSFQANGRSLVAVPSNEFRVTCTSTDEGGRFTQFLSIAITPEVFEKEIAPARTFCFFEEIEALKAKGLIRGGSLENAVVIKDDKVVNPEPLRFSDEFVRHKILDIIGDVSLLGRPMKAHIIAIKPGHACNVELTRSISRLLQPSKPQSPVHQIDFSRELSVDDIMRILPHRYPFLLVDKILKVEENRVVGVKNVSINEPFFQGHFPGHPVMPGVLQIEAMAQVAGVLILGRGPNYGKLAYFMSVDNAKFRRPVRPGDQLVLEVEMLKSRSKTGKFHGVARVNGEVVSETDFMFMVVDRES